MCRSNQSPYVTGRDLDMADSIEMHQQHQPLDVPQFKRSQAVGSPLMLPKPKGTMRIFAKNPNGISVGDGGNYPMILEDIISAEAVEHLETLLAAINQAGLTQLL